MHTTNATIHRANTYGWPVVRGLTAAEKAAVLRGERVTVDEDGKRRRVVATSRGRFVPRAI